METARGTRVCIITSAHPHDEDRAYFREALGLKAAGYEVVFIGPGREAETFTTPDGIQVEKIAHRGGLKSRAALNISILRRILSGDFDIVHCIEIDTLAVAVIAKILSRSRCRVVYDCHELTPAHVARNRKFPELPTRALTSIVWAAEWTLCAFVDEILDTNDTRAERFFRAMPRKTTVLLNVPPLEYLQKIGASRRAAGENNSRLVVASTGHFSPLRGLNFIIDALEILNADGRGRFGFLGVGRLAQFANDTSASVVEIEQAFTKRIREAGLDGCVEITGLLPYDEMYRRLADAQAGIVLLQPRRENDYTGLPTKIFDFMALGLPVIASDFPEIRKVVGGARCGILVDPGDPRAIADALRTLADNPEQRRQMGENGMKAVRERYNWENVEPLMLEAYSRVSAKCRERR